MRPDPLAARRGGGLAEIGRLVDLCFSLARKNFRVRYARTRLGPLWAVLQAVLLAVVITVVFEQVFSISRSVEHYGLYVLSGLLPFQFTMMAITESTISIVANASLVKKVALPRAIFPASSVLAVFIMMALALAVVVAGAAFAGALAVPRILLLVPTVVLCFGLALCGGLAGASMYVFRRDVQFGIESAGRILFYGTPIMYTSDRLSDGLQALQTWNPLVGMVSLSRAAVFGTPVDGAALAVTVGVIVVALPVSVFVFNRRAAIYADLV